jgi:hypothetical protein
MTELIESVGIELECGINDSQQNELYEFVCENLVADNYKEQHDGSVHVNGYTHGDIELTYWDGDMDRFYMFIKEAFRHVGQNSSCGNHLHVRFTKPKEALAVFSYKRTYDKLKKGYLKAFGEIGEDADYKERTRASKYASRIRNTYCKGEYNEDSAVAQISSMDKCCSRYNMVNLNAYNLWKTIEFRVLPYFNDGVEAVSSIKKYLKLVEDVYKSVLNEKRKVVMVNREFIRSHDMIYWRTDTHYKETFNVEYKSRQREKFKVDYQSNEKMKESMN